jgi:hypothetical protein
MPKGRFVTIFLISILYIPIARAADRFIVIDSLTVLDGYLCADYHIDGLLDEKFITGVERGFTSEIVHRISLWQKKKVISSLVSEFEFTVDVYYDNWEDTFAIIKESEKRLTTQIETVQEMCAFVRNYPLIKVAGLDSSSTFYISIDATIQPISDKTYEELREWMRRGKRTESEKKRKKAKFFDVLFDLMGFGDKNCSAKSADFIIRRKAVIEFVE